MVKSRSIARETGFEEYRWTTRAATAHVRTAEDNKLQHCGTWHPTSNDLSYGVSNQRQTTKPAGSDTFSLHSKA